MLREVFGARFGADVLPETPGVSVRLPLLMYALMYHIGRGDDENSAGLIVTAMRLLNAVPAVCEAPPRLLSALDIPLVTGRGLLG